MNFGSSLPHPNGDSLFFTRQEAARIAGVSVSTLDRLVKARQVPFKRVRVRVLFPKVAFINWCSRGDEGAEVMGVAA